MRITILASFLLLAGCQKPVDNRGSGIPLREYSVQSVLWQQQSAEYKALCYQAFSLARLRLDILLGEGAGPSKPPAIVTDIDETVFDNSPFDAKLIETDRDYSRELWYEWGRREEAHAIPGALTADPCSLDSEWRYYRDGHAWLCKFRYRKKTVLWLSVFEGYFKVAFYFSAGLSEGVGGLHIGREILDSFEKAEFIGKVKPLVVTVMSGNDIGDVLKIVGYKKKKL